MAKKPTITSITSGYASTNTLNDNFEALRDAFDNTLSLDGSTPNSMTSDLNLNNNDILNASRILVGGVDYIATALSYKNDAETAKTAAEAAQAAAELAYDNFDDRYLGAKSSDPTVDNDGNALLDGALYYDIANTVIKFYDTSTSTWYRTTPTTSDQTNIDIVAGNTTNINTVAGISSDVTTVAGISSDVTTVAADGTDIGTVATSISNVNTAATNISNINTVAGISANVTTVAGNTTNINTVAGNNSNITTVAGISSDVTTVAGQTTNLQNVTDNLTAIQNAATNATNAANSASAAATSAAAAAASADFFDDVYLGSKASDPATDNDGDALNAGDLYFNTTSNNLKVYSGSAWQDAAVDSSGFVQTTGGTMTGNLTVPNVIVSGNVDGRDVSADGTKLDGIEANADVTDTANVTAAGALMDSELTDIAAVKALNQGVATTDAPTFTNTQLDAIAATISDTAVDIFVYDTRKDSDGGAWRKRTQHTSWYNETLNTATRGSRKEFPAVAVIVVQSDKIAIYDGDDPDLPMWMIADDPNQVSATYAIKGAGGNPNNTISCVSAMNGKLITGGGGPYSSHGVIIWDFILDKFGNYSVSTVWSGFTTGNLADRQSLQYIQAGTLPLIIDGNVNDVAMTVLPNAPIDAATGLPVPTIAVATNGGVSVIKDDGTVVDKGTAGAAAHKVAWLGSNIVVTAPLYYGIFTDPFTEESSSYLGNISDANYFWAEVSSIYNTPRPLGDVTEMLTMGNDTIISASADHSAVDGVIGKAALNIHRLGDGSLVDNNNGLAAHIGSNFNTGYQVGDIKLATLSDTDDTNVTGSELVTNGTFDTDTDWTKQTDWAISGGVATYSGTTYNYISQDITTVVGETYVATVEITAITAGALQLRIMDGATEIAATTQTTLGTHAVTFVATNTTTTVRAYASFSGARFAGSVDNISVRLAEEDRSVNGNGLQVFGTVTKSAVATGADLVAYSGFSSSNYLQQPYNSDLDFGTGDFCYQFWEKHTAPATTYGWIVDYDREATAGWVLIGATNGTQMRFEVASGVLADVAAPYGVWNCWAFVRRNNVCYVYHNGEQIASFSDGGANINASSRGNGLNLGALKSASSTEHFTTGSLALFRISATAPSPEQIKKIYEDEKVLFQDGAQATLYGSSDAVTALAYDDSTELLHVGTSAGRSVFQGLRRVDNTTTAVGAAISASNGLVADE